MAATRAGVDSVLVNWGFSNHKTDAIETVEELKKRILKKYLISSSDAAKIKNKQL